MGLDLLLLVLLGSIHSFTVLRADTIDLVISSTMVPFRIEQGVDMKSVFTGPPRKLP
jgi:hypothetical protein